MIRLAAVGCLAFFILQAAVWILAHPEIGWQISLVLIVCVLAPILFWSQLKIFSRFLVGFTRIGVSVAVALVASTWLLGHPGVGRYSAVGFLLGLIVLNVLGAGFSLKRVLRSVLISSALSVAALSIALRNLENPGAGLPVTLAIVMGIIVPITLWAPLEIILVAFGLATYYVVIVVLALLMSTWLQEHPTVSQPVIYVLVLGAALVVTLLRIPRIEMWFGKFLDWFLGRSSD
ncbi:MAG: hypothetical protein ACRDGG_02935 [Anaerolineae bacterium]